MKKIILILLILATVLPHRINCEKWDKESRNIAIGVCAVVVGLGAYKYYYSNPAPTKPEKIEESNEKIETITSTLKTSDLYPVNPQTLCDKKEIVPQKKPILDEQLFEPNHSEFPQKQNKDLAKKIYADLETISSNIFKADIDNILISNLSILEG